VPVNFDASESVPIVAELAKLIKLTGKHGPTTVAKHQNEPERRHLSVYMSWNADGELKIH
jgi:hypothetical protein